MIPPAPGNEDFFLEGGEQGVLMLHGFTANPYALRPFAEHLHSLGFSVSVPRYPGHGTTWEDLERTGMRDWVGEARMALDRLLERCTRVGLVGLSFGTAMGAILAARKPDPIRAFVSVNPYVRDHRLLAAPLVRLARRSVRGVGDDIRKQGVTERPYPRVPLTALMELNRALAAARRALPLVRAPLLLARSNEDHTVPKANAEVVVRSIGSAQKRLLELPRSFHVAWVDEDAELLFRESGSFLERHLAG